MRPVPDVNGQEGIQIYFGVLVHQINRMVFNTDGLVSQTGLGKPASHSSNSDGWVRARIAIDFMS